MIPNKVPIVCFIGSMKFWDDMLIEASKFHQEGKIVILPIKDIRDEIPEEDLNMYDKLIRVSIDMADQVHVINRGGYIGKSVKSEIEYAQLNGTPITYMEEPIKIVTLCGSYRFTSEFNMITEAFTRAGILTLIPALLNINFENMPVLTENEIKKLHDIHYMKIDMSDAVIIINTGIDKDEYIGDDTAREINYAGAKNKSIIYLSDFSEISDLIKCIKGLPFNERRYDNE